MKDFPVSQVSKTFVQKQNFMEMQTVCEDAADDHTCCHPDIWCNRIVFFAQEPFQLSKMTETLR